ncbi:MAG: tetratricopeptide repeat protein [Bacteroides sp.]|nr:tetratricopeptide repeat protein [Bacteroidales bacterium]MBD5379183.1 tetratricopeptide repeat protein [Bacteroides sp.]MDE5808838.1 tetratricopeptide repeat protein [Muribaculaceae bacterium]
MAKNNQPEEQATGIEELNENLVSVTEKVQKNQKVIMWCTLGVAIVVAIILAYVYLIHEPSKAKGNEEIGKADLQLVVGNDSVALSQYLNVADKMGGDAANRAALQSACLLYEKGEYQKALDYARKFSSSESVIAAAALSLEGDCYVNLDNLDAAVKAYKSAISKSNDNTLYTPFFMMKLARVYREQKNYKAEADIYGEIVKKYPQYGDAYGIDVDKLLARAQAEASK